MKRIKENQLNVYNDFMDHFNKLTKVEVLIWVKAVMGIHKDERFSSYKEEVISLINDYINDKKNVSEARTLAFKIHKEARTQQNDAQFYLRALAHMVSTIHEKTHALKCCDYIIKYIQFITKSNDSVVGERLRQIQLIYQTK